MKNTITLNTSVWSGYWEKYGKMWAKSVNNFNTKPDEIVIVSDTKINTSLINHNNIKNIIFTEKNNHKLLPQYRNLAVEHSNCDWFVPLDLDDFAMPNYLDNLDDSADIHGFSFLNKDNGIVSYPDDSSLNRRLLNIFDEKLIPGTSAIKRNLFDRIKYQDNCYEDHILFATASKLNLKVSHDVEGSPYRFYYSGRHPEKNSKEINRVSKIYTEVISGKRNIYCFLFSSNIKDSEKKYIENLGHCCKVNLIIVNEKNFYNYENEEMPIHPYFKFLSDTNKAHYAKSYMRYFYGGGYPEIEAKIFDWNIYFDELFLSSNDSIICGDDVKNNIKPFENFQYVFKPKTRSSFDYIAKINHILNKKQDRYGIK